MTCHTQTSVWTGGFPLCPPFPHSQSNISRPLLPARHSLLSQLASLPPIKAQIPPDHWTHHRMCFHGLGDFLTASPLQAQSQVPKPLKAPSHLLLYHIHPPRPELTCYKPVCTKTAFDPGVFVTKSAQNHQNFHFATQTHKTFEKRPFFSDTEILTLLTWVIYPPRYYMRGDSLVQTAEEGCV